MFGKTPVRASDLRGLNRLAIDATMGVTDVVEAMHHNIFRAPGTLPSRTRGITGLVYRTVRGITRIVGGGVDATLAPFARLGEGRSSTRREAVLAALNGVSGDHLAATGNPLAIPMSFRQGGEPLVPSAGRRLLVLVHGLCMNDLEWNREGHDHGAALARDLGFTPVYLHYNSGLHISTNGRGLAGLLEDLVERWPVSAEEPVEEMVILGHSMGGLVTRSACHYGSASGHAWLRHLKKIVFLGAPHHGSALERGGNRVESILGISRYTAPLARLGQARSAGITDLRHGNLLDEDWQGRDRFEEPEDLRRPVPLPEGVRCYAMAASAKVAGSLKSRLLGDGLVPVESALGRHEEAGRTLPIPESRQWIAPDMTHFDLLSRPEAYEKIREWIAD